MKVFTNENFKGYEFKCDTTSANTGFTQTCRVYNSDGEEIREAKSSITWGNRTWESYQYKLVYEGSQEKLRKVLAGEYKEYDTDFLDTLMYNGYITDYGLFGDSENYVLIMSSWTQVDGESHWEDGKKVITKPSVYNKLVELANKNLLKPSINYTILNTEFVFDDEYDKCSECGRVYNTYYGELTWDDFYGYLCNDCMNNNTEVIENLIELAKEDFRKALKVGVSEEILNDLGYYRVDDTDFSTRMTQWGESSYGCHNTHVSVVEDVCKTYGGFPKLTYVGQFDAEYNIFLPSEYIRDARIDLGLAADDDEDEE